MCINVANEQLQQYFNQHIFQWEQEECEKEGVVLGSISYTCNQPILDVFLGKNVGLLAILDEESRFPRATDKSLALKLHKTLGSKGAGIYVAPPNKGTTFGVSHYAGYVSVLSLVEPLSNRHLELSSIKRYYLEDTHTSL
jgi:myosin heavy subunit